MKYYRCKCGKWEAWSTLGVVPCDWCEDCQTGPAEYPGRHPAERTPHRMVRHQVMTDAGASFLSRCQWCGRQQADLEGQPTEAPDA